MQKLTNFLIIFIFFIGLVTVISGFWKLIFHESQIEQVSYEYKGHVYEDCIYFGTTMGPELETVCYEEIEVFFGLWDDYVPVFGVVHHPYRDDVVTEITPYDRFLVNHDHEMAGAANSILR